MSRKSSMPALVVILGGPQEGVDGRCAHRYGRDGQRLGCRDAASRNGRQRACTLAHHDMQHIEAVAHSNGQESTRLDTVLPQEREQVS